MHIYYAYMTRKNNRITSFKFKEGDVLVGKYKVLQKVGSGWEAEVYLVREMGTGIERAAKFFFPHRNKKNHNLKFYARKLHKLRNCPILIQYHTQEILEYKGQNISFLLSQFVEGELLSDFLKYQPSRRLRPFEALHLLYALARGIEDIHRVGEYHGDLHSANVIIQRHGLEFDLKLVDFFQWKTPKPENRQDDICNMIYIFYEALGGQAWYSKQPDEVKAICLGLKRTLILKKFRTTTKLKSYIEGLEW